MGVFDTVHHGDDIETKLAQIIQYYRSGIFVVWSQIGKTKENFGTGLPLGTVQCAQFINGNVHFLVGNRSNTHCSTIAQWVNMDKYVYHVF